MSNYKKTNINIFSKPNLDVTLDNIYWRNFSAPVLVKEFGPIDYIHFSAKEPHHFAVTCSCRVQIYNAITKLVIKNFNKFKEIAYGGNFRRDERLLCAGGDEAVIKLFNVNTRSPLRIFSGHSASVHRTFFTLDGMHIASFSDDKTSILWDITTEKKLLIFKEHNDYVRAGSVSPVSPDIYISGGYDKIINMYDRRTNKKIFSVNHDAPVESLVFLPSGGIFLSAGGTEIRVWDCLSNGRLLAKICSHFKTITCLQIACNGQRILSGSLDKHVKIYDSGTYKIMHTLDYPNSVLSIGTSVNNETIVAGMVDGLISIRQKEDINEKLPNYKSKYDEYSAENLYSPSADVYVHDSNKDVIGKHDICLRKFEYSKALDSVMVNYIVNKSPQTTVSLFQELIRRQGLHYALAGRDDKSLSNILKFIIRYIGDIKFQRVLVYISNALIDTYEDKIEEVHFISQSMFKHLAKKLQELQDYILSLIKLQGAFETLLSAGEIAVIPAIKHSFKITPSETAQGNLILNVS